MASVGRRPGRTQSTVRPSAADRRSASAPSTEPPTGTAVEPAAEPDTVLVRWVEVFPLSQSPEERVARLLGADATPDDVARTTTAYVEAITAVLPLGVSLDATGAVVGPSPEAEHAGDRLFAAVMQTDLDAVVRRARSTAQDPDATG